MLPPEQPPSLDALLGLTNQVDHELLVRRMVADEQVFTARDDWSLIEVGVNGMGELVEVAINAKLAPTVALADLAGAVLEAGRAAQQRARESRDIW